jgi:large subunit ribosomal protein L4e
MANKVWEQKVNRKEHDLAIASGLAASLNKALLKARGHKSEHSPVVVADDFENVKKAKEIEMLFEKLGLGAELERCREKKVRAGRGKMRGRRYQKKKGVLVIVAEDCAAMKAARNLPGVDAATVAGLNAELLAPGCQAGRLIVLTKNAVAAIAKKYE